MVVWLSHSCIEQASQATLMNRLSTALWGRSRPARSASISHSVIQYRQPHRLSRGSAALPPCPKHLAPAAWDSFRGPSSGSRMTACRCFLSLCPRDCPSRRLVWWSYGRRVRSSYRIHREPCVLHRLCSSCGSQLEVFAVAEGMVGGTRAKMTDSVKGAVYWSQGRVILRGFHRPW